MRIHFNKKSSVLLGTAVLILGFLSLPVQAQQKGYTIVEIQVTEPEQIQQIADLGIDIWHIDGNRVTAYVSPSDREALRNAGLAFNVTVEDVEAFIQQRIAAEAPSALVYHTYDTLVADLYALEASGIARAYLIGDTWEGRNILAVRISDNPDVNEGEPSVVLVGCHHAREWISVEVAYYIAKYLVDNYATDPQVQALVNNGEVWIAPMINPDGHQYSVVTDRLWRKNRRFNNPSYGVDTNRNYATGWGGSGSSGDPYSEIYRGPFPFSEPETQALRDLFLDPAHNVKAMITYHSYGQLILYPWGYTYAKAPDHCALDFIAKGLESRIEAVHEMNYVPMKSSGLYLASGTTDDWTYDVRGIPSYTIELRPLSDFPGFLLPPSEIQPTYEENIPAALYLIGLTQNDEDGDGVTDIEDNCIGVYNPGQVDSDGDHIGAACDCNDHNPEVCRCDFTLLSPQNGSQHSLSPTFEWTSGNYTVFLFYSLFSYSGYGYYPVHFWLPSTSLPMPANWWNVLAPGYPHYWAVLGYNTATHAWGLAGPWWFTKEEALTHETRP